MILRELIDIISGENKKKRRRSNAALFVLGSGVAFLAALFVVPHRGKDTRRVIADSAINTRLRIERSTVKAINRAKESHDKLSDNVKQISEDVKVSIDAIKTSVTEVQDLKAKLGRNIRHLKRIKTDPKQSQERLRNASERLKNETRELSRALD